MRFQFLALCLTFGFAGAATAAPCFDDRDRPIYVDGKDCKQEFADHQATAGALLASDKNGAPLYRAHAVTITERRRTLTKFGIEDMMGRLVAPAQFDNVSVVSRTLGVGEAALTPGNYDTRRAFLIDLSNGEIRATPFRTIKVSPSFGVGSPSPFLVGIQPGENLRYPSLVGLLYPSGEDTGVRLNTQAKEVQTYPHGLLRVGADYFSITGEPAAGGRKMYEVGSWGLYAEMGPRPPEVRGQMLDDGKLYLPLDNLAQPQTPAHGILGLIRGSYTMWIVQRTPAGLRYYKHDTGTPDVTRPPTGEAYLDLFIGRNRDVVRTSRGWSELDYGAPVFATAEAATADADAKSDAIRSAVRAEYCARNHCYDPRAAEQQRAAQEAATAVARDRTIARIEQAKRENWAGFRLYDLQRDVIGLQLEGRYVAAGLYVSPDFKREVCRSRASSICDAPSAPSSSGGSGFVSTWEQAFANGRALNQQQGRDNCAAALMGASRICTLR